MVTVAYLLPNAVVAPMALKPRPFLLVLVASETGEAAAAGAFEETAAALAVLAAAEDVSRTEVGVTDVAMETTDVVALTLVGAAIAEEADLHKQA
jgi:hypothetical protein